MYVECHTTIVSELHAQCQSSEVLLLPEIFKFRVQSAENFSLNPALIVERQGLPSLCPPFPRPFFIEQRRSHLHVDLQILTWLKKSAITVFHLSACTDQPPWIGTDTTLTLMRK